MLTLLILLCCLWLAYWTFAYFRDRNKRTPTYISRTRCSDCVEQSKQLPNNQAAAPEAPAPVAATAEIKASKEPTAVADMVTAEKPSKGVDALDDAPKQTEEKPAQSKPVAKSSTSNVVPLFKAPSDEADDLKKIKGIGVVMEKTLNDLGITTFQQLSEFESTEVKMVSDALSESNSGFGDRISRDEWVEQAKLIVRKAS